MIASRKSVRLVECLIVTVAVCLLDSQAEAQTFVNNSFEEQIPGQFVNGGDDKMVVTAAPGWTINVGSPDWLYGPGVSLWDTNWGNYLQLAGAFIPATGVGGPIPTGGASFFLREGVGQAVSGFTPGGLYRIDFHHTNGFGETPLVPPPSGGWELFVDGTSVKLAPSTNAIGSIFPLPHTTAWQASSHVFQATSASHQFDFVAYRQGGQGAASAQWLDNVSITRVPEPQTLAILLLNGILVCSRRRRLH